ncbi:MAG: chromate transporter, chromate ion transporter family [Herbinix sp.]|jgi:chromate transporter|nr:chromate transporter, chromate ion transporter family [Herbinix sp.]
MQTKVRKYRTDKNEFYSLEKAEQHQRLKEIALVFLKLGSVAFGGPAAHVAMMENELVKKRKWLEKDRFLDLYGATNLLPGPNSTELAIHIGYERGGWLGLILAGSCFILPAMIIVMIIAMIYSIHGTLPEITGIMYGIKPVVIAIILQALIRLGQSAIKNKSTGVIGVLVIVLSFFGFHELLLLAAAGLIMMLIANRGKLMRTGTRLSVFVPFFLLTAVAPPSIFLTTKTSPEKFMGLTRLFLTFLKIGSVLYGSGYVLLAFLEADFVERFQVLTKTQLLDAVSVGQITPGPVFTTATFIGYILHGFPGGILATIGIFLPAFLLVVIVNPYIHRLRSSTWFSGILDGVNVASWGLMTVVSWKLAIAAIIDIPTLLLAILSIIVVFRFKINSFWLVLGGAITGYLVSTFL